MICKQAATSPCSSSARIGEKSPVSVTAIQLAQGPASKARQAEGSLRLETGQLALQRDEEWAPLSEGTTDSPA